MTDRDPEDVHVDTVGHRRFCQLFVADGKKPNRSATWVGAGPRVIGDRRFPVESTDRDRIGEAARILRARDGRPGMKPDRVGVYGRRRLIGWYQSNLRASPPFFQVGTVVILRPSSFDCAQDDITALRMTLRRGARLRRTL